MESKEAFSVNQLEKIANYFKRNLRWKSWKRSFSEVKIFSPR
jgi:hypothetical protein